MADDRNRRTGSFAPLGSPSGGQVSRDRRMSVAVPFRYRYQSFIDFVETQSINVSRSGMFIASNEPLPAGSVVEFEFALADGYPLLKGRAEVVRVSAHPPGMGLRFQQLDEQSRKLIERIAEVNSQEGKKPTVSLDFTEAQVAPSGQGQMGRSASGSSLGVEFLGRDLRIDISPSTAPFFVNNPLLNIRLGGFVVPGPEDVPLGTQFNLTILDLRRATVFEGKGKVVAKHEHRLGIRLLDVPKETLARLQAEVSRASAGNK